MQITSKVVVSVESIDANTSFKKWLVKSSLYFITIFLLFQNLDSVMQLCAENLQEIYLTKLNARLFPLS